MTRSVSYKTDLLTFPVFDAAKTNHILTWAEPEGLTFVCFTDELILNKTSRFWFFLYVRNFDFKYYIQWCMNFSIGFLKVLIYVYL
jgi:hypothetical protein